MKLNLPLIEGERPLFAALDLCKSLYKAFQRKIDLYENIKYEDIIRDIVKINVLLEIIEIRRKYGYLNNNQDILEHMFKLPLFFNQEKVKDWEVNKIWNNISFLDSKELMISYESYFTTFEPSKLYQVDNNINRKVWERWLVNSPENSIIDIFEHSSKRMLNWVQALEDKSNVINNLKALSKYIGFEDKDFVKNWSFFNILAADKSNLWSLYLKENKNKDNIKDLIFIWEKSLGLKPNDMNSLLAKDSILVELGMYNVNVKEDKKNNWYDFWNETQRFEIKDLDNKLLNDEKIIETFIIKESDDSLPLSFFSYIKGLNELIALFSKVQVGRVLIYSNGVTGKATLAKSILKALGKNVFTITSKKEKDENSLYLANRLASKFKDSALLIEDYNKTYNLKDKYSINFGTLEFWTSSNIKDISKSELKKFDYFIELEYPKINERINIAKFLFKNHPDVAVKVAQSFKCPFQIIKVRNLCYDLNDFSLKTVNLIINNLKNIENMAGVNLSEIDIEEDIPDLVGYPKLNSLLEDLIKYYDNPNKYIKLGVKPNKGILLIGPPGTGKTHFVKTLSQKINVPIYTVSSTELSNNLEGIREVFNKARKNAPCILFIDEIDILIANPLSMMGVDMGKQKVVNEFLSQMDGVESNEGLLIIGATHRGDNIEEAARRSGRLSKVIYLNYPDEESREKIWESHLKGKVFNKNISYNELSKLSAGFSPSDIMEASNIAGIKAVEEDAEQIEIKHFKEACDDVFWGSSDDDKRLSEEEITATAYHEAGHAIMAWKTGHEVQRITIKPRNQFLGAVNYENKLESPRINDIRNQVQILLGGICAEKIIYKEYSAGGVSDLSKAELIIHNAITKSGLGNLKAISLTSDMRAWSEEMKVKIELEKETFMQEAFNNAFNSLKENIEILEELKNYLLKNKEVSGKELLAFKNKISK